MREYLHPYRSWLPEVWGATSARRYGAGGAAALATGGVATLATGDATWVLMGLAIVVFTIWLFAYWTALGAWHIHRVTRAWDSPGELTRVRTRRPHAGARDPEFAHDEFAVTVEDSGHLFLWRFTPMLAREGGPEDAIIVPGRPTYAAQVVAEREFDPTEASRAAEQLAQAQDDAAGREREAAQRAVDQDRVAAGIRELAAERLTTAEALQHLTGQRDT